MKTHARVVVIGGGMMGASLLYHLALEGCTDTVLIEKNELTSGSTWHAAGNCPNFSTSWNVIKFQRCSTRLYAELGSRVGYPINYHVTGSIRLAHRRQIGDTHGRELHTARQPLEQRKSQVRLERPDLIADRPRREAELQGGGAEARGARGRLEGAQPSQGRQTDQGTGLVQSIPFKKVCPLRLKYSVVRP